MKETLAKKRYYTGEEVQDAARDWLSNIGREYFRNGIEELGSSYDGCLNKFGSSVEKYISN